MTTAPIALFVYNRPWHTRQTIVALQMNELAGESDLFIFSDAPSNTDAADAVREVREYIRNVTGFKSISIIERSTNFGLAESITDGITRLCVEYGRVIVLEDDLVTAPYFLMFMNRALDLYRARRKCDGHSWLYVSDQNADCGDVLSDGSSFMGLGNVVAGLAVV